MVWRLRQGSRRDHARSENVSAGAAVAGRRAVLSTAALRSSSSAAGGSPPRGFNSWNSYDAHK